MSVKNKAGVKNEAGRAVLLLGAMGFWVMGDNYAASPMLVDIAQDFGLEIGTAAMVVVAYMIPFGLFTFIFGPLGDRYGKLRIIAVASFGTAIFSSLGALAFNLPSLLAVRAVNGGFAAAILPVSVSYIGDIFKEPRAEMNAIGQMMGMFFLGAAAATAIGGGLSFLGSWRLVYLTYGIAELIIVIIILKSLEFDRGTAEKLGFRRAYSNAFARPRLLKTVVLLFLVGFAVFGSFTYLGDFLVEMTGYNILVVGLILTLFGLAAFAGGRRVGNLRQLLGPRLFSAGRNNRADFLVTSWLLARTCFCITGFDWFWTGLCHFTVHHTGNSSKANASAAGHSDVTGFLQYVCGRRSWSGNQQDAAQFLGISGYLLSGWYSGVDGGTSGF